MLGSPHSAARTAPILIAAALLSLGFGRCERRIDPIVFVHGGSGSGAQFESQAMRFTSNGVPARWIDVVEYDSGIPFPEGLPAVHAKIDAKIDEILTRTRRDRVVLMGHSRGTTVSHDYLSFPDRAARVSHYVNIDGRSADAPPGGVPTLALWAAAVDRPVQGEIVGARNVTVPGQEHVEVATSEEAFVEMYTFLRGHPPWTSKILPELRPRVSGRVVVFPANEGVDGAVVNVWRVYTSSGERIHSWPDAHFSVGPDGAWGPFRAWAGAYYEFEVLREGQDINGDDLLPLHIYYEPFVRSDHLVRLNTSPTLEGILPKSSTGTGMAIFRYKEFWGDRGADNDVLTIDGTNVINPSTAPSGAVGAASVGFFVLDQGQDMMTDLTVVPFPFTILSFLTGADLYVPADPADDPITVVTVPRGDLDATRMLNVRRIPSDRGRTTVQLRDFEQRGPSGKPFGRFAKLLRAFERSGWEHGRHH